MEIKNINDVMEEYSDGTKHIPFYAFPGGYPIYYITADGGILCPDCVNDNLARIRQVDTQCPDDDQWRVIAVEIHEEGSPIQCDNCYKQIESAYGDPDE